MEAPREIELKLELEPRRPGRAPPSAIVSGESSTRRLLSRYFDTDTHALRRHGMVLRVRQEGEFRTQTLKGEGERGPISRREWEAAIDGDSPQIEALPDDDLRELVAGMGTLSPVFETEVTRTIWHVTRGTSKIEVALDQGRVSASGTSRPLLEVELELKWGSLEDLFGLARDIAQTHRVRFGVMSKAERGYALASGAGGGPVKAEPVKLHRRATVAEAFQTIAHNCIRHFRLNEPMVLATRDAEALHQARVALRRLRSAFSLFKGVVAGADADRIKAELGAVSRLLGEARNLDVYLERRLPHEAAAHPGEPGLPDLADRLAADRERAYDRIARRLSAKRFRLMMLDLVALVECGDWLKNETLAGPRGERAADFAARTLSARWRKVKKAGRHLETLDPEARHEVRIAAKKLRYASEFFGSLSRGRKAKRRRKDFIEALQALQGTLGDLNDIVTGHETAFALAHKAGAGMPPELLFAAGHSSGGEDATEADLLVRAAKAHRALRKAEPFWT